MEAAISGVRFGIQSGWINPDSNQNQLDKIFLGRSTYFLNVFGVRKKEDIYFKKNDLEIS